MFWLWLFPLALGQEDDDERAKALYDEGTRLYEAGQYEEAVEVFQIAYGLSERPLLLFNLAHALERLGRWEEARDALQQYRAVAPESDWETLDSRIRELDERIAARPTAAESETVAVVEEPGRSGPPVGAYVLFGTGAAGIGAGAIFTAQALSARSDWQEACADGAACPAQAAEAWQRDNRASLVADIAWGIGAVGVVGGVVLSLGSGSADLTLAARPGAVWIGGRF